MLYTENQMRMPENTEKRLSELAAAPTIRDAIPILMDILDNYDRYELYKCIQWDPSTGDKLRFEWKPGDKFSRFICLRSGCSPEIKFHSDVATFFKQEVMTNDKALYFNWDNGHYVITRYFSSYDGRYEVYGIRIQELFPLPI